MIDLKAHKPAKRYATALFEEIVDKNYNKVFDEIEEFLSLYENDKEFRTFFSHPIISVKDKKEVIEKCFQNYEFETKNFLFILIDEDRLGCLDEIRDYLTIKVNDKNKLILADVTLAVDIPDYGKEIIKDRLQKKFNSEVKINFKKDESLIAGMLIRIKDTVFDLSVKRKIEKFKTI